VSKVVSFTGTEQLDELAASLKKAIEVAPAATRLVVQKGALNIKTDARRRVSGHKHLPAYPNSITYDTTEALFGASAEIGPDKSRPQGPLGNIIEFGGTRQAPIPHMLPAAEAEEPKFVAAMEALAIKSLGPALS
jgi:hypothetical protein